MQRTARNSLWLTALILCCSPYASADYDDDDYRNSHHYNKGHTTYAKVIRAEPIYRSVKRRVPERECHIESVAYQEPVHYSQPQTSYQSATPLLLGALVGGGIGHELGHHKKARNAGAVIGAVVGGSLGRDLYQKSRNNQYHQPQTITRYRDQEVCHTRHRKHYEEVLDGYHVTYQYKGRTYHTRTDQHPGRKIRVEVQVRPVD